ncbi:MAG: membrane protein insertion efficiency factor YidD [Bacilli bacterium]|nr:membrane protein insertion efficiency factor YidD [Bacilli bacterium]
MKKVLIGLIKIYQAIPGPWHAACRHTPTCSNYAIEAINIYGCIKGSYMGFVRILKCNPWGSSGYDPVVKEDKNDQKNT